MINNKRGFTDHIVLVVIMLIVLGGIIFAFWLWSILGPTATGLVTETTGSIRSAVGNSSDGNLTAAVTPSLNAIDDSLASLEWITYIVVIMLMFGFFIMCFYVRTYPFLVFIWIGGIIILTILSFFITSSYDDIVRGTDSVAANIKGWGASHYLMSNLPGVLVTIGIIGGIVMFVLISKDGEPESVYI